MSDKTKTKLIDAVSIELTLDGTLLDCGKFMNFANALETAVKYARDENLEDFRMKKKLLETLVPTSKSTAKTALLFGKLSSNQIKEIRQNAGYTNEGEFLKSTSYKG